MAEFTETTLTGTVSLIGGSGDLENVKIQCCGNSTYADASGNFSLAAYIGTWYVTAELPGYKPTIVEDVEIIEGTSITIELVKDNLINILDEAVSGDLGDYSEYDPEDGVVIDSGDATYLCSLGLLIEKIASEAVEYSDNKRPAKIHKNEHLTPGEFLDLNAGEEIMYFIIQPDGTDFVEDFSVGTEVGGENIIQTVDIPSGSEPIVLTPYGGEVHNTTKTIYVSGNNLWQLDITLYTITRQVFTI